MSDKKKKVEDDGDDMPSSPAWMGTFADMMTLLMCFFILIMSFSTMELDKFKMAMGSLKGAFGVIGIQKKLAPDQSWFSPSNVKQRSVLDHLQKMRKSIENNKLEDKVDVQWSDEGELFVQIKDNMLFSPGKADLRPNYLKLLSIIAKLFFGEAEQIIVEGHTDNVPISTPQYPSNWELSLDRALHVLRYFVNKKMVDPTRISASGFGEHKPLVPNTSTKNRAKNRRVVIRVKI
ncbi:MAG: flagellar motor protein MotB [bacterium]